LALCRTLSIDKHGQDKLASFPSKKWQPSVGYLKRINHWWPMENRNTLTQSAQFSRCNHVKENSNASWPKKLLASWMAKRVSSKHPGIQLTNCVSGC